MKKQWLFFGMIALIAASCVPYKKVLYMTDLDEKHGVLEISEPEVRGFIQGDLLEINISSISRETNEYFLKPGSDSESKSSPNTYQISAEGNIDLPLIGRVPLEGKTPAEAEDLLRERLLEYLQKPVVNVRLVNFSVTVLGEVKMPGVYAVPSGSANVLQALGRAGDITLFGQRDNILLVRNHGGDKVYHRLDMNHSGFLSSDHFNLQNNDVIYVPPSRGRSSADDNVYRLLPLVLSGLTFVAVIISLTR